MRKRVIRTWKIVVPQYGDSVLVPVMHPKAEAMKAYGKGQGMVEILDEPARHMADLDFTTHELELILCERSGRSHVEVHVPERAEHCIGSFWDNFSNQGYFVFTTRSKR